MPMFSGDLDPELFRLPDSWWQHQVQCEWFPPLASSTSFWPEHESRCNFLRLVVPRRNPGPRNPNRRYTTSRWQGLFFERARTITDSPMGELGPLHASSLEIPPHMQFDRCVPLAWRSTASLPAGRQRRWQRHRATIFKHNRRKSAHQCERNVPVSLDDNRGHLL